MLISQLIHVDVCWTGEEFCASYFLTFPTSIVRQLLKAATFLRDGQHCRSTTEYCHNHNVMRVYRFRIGRFVNNCFIATMPVVSFLRCKAPSQLVHTLSPASLDFLLLIALNENDCIPQLLAQNPNHGSDRYLFNLCLRHTLLFRGALVPHRLLQ